MKALVVDCRNCHGINTISVAVEVALIPVRSTIATGKYKDRALSASSVVNAVNNSLVNEISRTLHRPSIVWRTPTAAVNGNILEPIIESSRFINVGNGAGKNTNTRNLGFISYANAASIIFSSCYLAGASCAMVVVKVFGCWQGFMIIEVVRVVRILKEIQFFFLDGKREWFAHKISSQIFTLIIQTVVDQR